MKTRRAAETIYRTGMRDGDTRPRNWRDPRVGVMRLAIALLTALVVATLTVPASARAQDAPPPPTNLEATANSDGHVVLSWTAPDDDSVTGYQVLRRRPSEGEDSLQVYVADTESTDTTYTDTNVTAGVRHVYRVKAINAAGVGGRSNYVNVTPQRPQQESPESPPAPANLEAAANSNGRVVLSWIAPDDDSVTGFQILRRRPSEDEDSLQVYVTDTGSTATTYTDTNVTAGVQHVYRVKAINSAGVSGWSNYVNVTPPQPQDNQQVPRQPDNEPATGVPVISGTAQVGETLTADTSGVADGNGLATAVFTYEWLADGVAISGATGSTYTIADTDVGKAISVTVRFIDDAGNAESVTSRAMDAVEEEPEIAEQQQVNCSPAIESVGGSATNRRALWTWESDALDNACGSRWFDFRLAYSTDFGATFTEAAVVRRAIHTAENEAVTVGDFTLNRNEDRYSLGSIPETSLISVLRVSAGCDDAGENCASTVKSTDASLDTYYYSKIDNRKAGANTRALLVPDNFGVAADSKKDWDPASPTASVVGLLAMGDTHTYRIPMIAGKTYIFDEHYRKWGMLSGEWYGAKHYYIPDEWRLSLYTKNSAGRLVPVTGFQDQPERGWQALFRDPDFQIMPYDLTDWAHSGWNEYFDSLNALKPVLDNAQFFPPGSQYATLCGVMDGRGRGLDVCGIGFDINTHAGRQLRRPSFTPAQSAVYYLQVTRVHDDKPKWGPDITEGSQETTHSDHVCCRTEIFEKDDTQWYIPVAGYDSNDSAINGGDSTPDHSDIDENDLPTYRRMLNHLGDAPSGRGTIPYYELSVEVRGPLLASISITDASNNDVFGNYRFSPSRFNYVLSLHSSASDFVVDGLGTVMVSATAAQSDATVTITSPADADTSTDGHQVNVSAASRKTVTITVTRGDDTETYTVKLSRR